MAREQRFRMVNLDRREQLFNAPLCDFFLNQYVTAGLLVRPYPPPRPVRPTLWTVAPLSRATKLSTATPWIVMLPTELLLLIFEQLDSLDDVIALCISHDILGAVGEDLLLERVSRAISQWSWAGDRIICAGDSCQDDDLPENVQADFEKTISAALRPNGASAAHTFLQLIRDHFTSPSLVRAGITSRIGGAGLLARKGSIRAWEKSGTVSPRDALKLDRILGTLEEMARFPDDQADNAVLCNLSKAEHVRGNAVKKLREIVDSNENANSTHFDLGIVALAYTVWSSDPSCGYKHLGDESELRLTRGPWAGDRLEIMHFDDMPARVAWRDVTDETVEWLCELCEFEWGGSALSQYRRLQS